LLFGPCRNRCSIMRSFAAMMHRATSSVRHSGALNLLWSPVWSAATYWRRGFVS